MYHLALRWRRPVRRADNLTTFMCRLSWNPGASTSWNPQGLSRPVMGLLYHYLLQLIVFPDPLLYSILLLSACRVWLTLYVLSSFVFTFNFSKNTFPKFVTPKAVCRWINKKTNQSVHAVSGTSRCFFSDKYKTHKYSVGRTHSCWMLNCWCIT